MKKNLGVLVLSGIIIFLFLFFLSVFLGTKALSFSDGVAAFGKFLRGEQAAAEGAEMILLKLRLPRTVAVVFCGIALSVSGLLLQSALNNSLASPGIIGVNSGAGLFVLLSSLIFPFSFWGHSIGAMSGALLSVLLVYLISIKAGVSKTTLVLAGVAISSLMTAGIDIVITFRPEIVTDKVAFNLGGFGNLNLQGLKLAVPIILIGVGKAFVLAGGIDLFALGDETAFGLGLNVKACRLWTIIVSGVLAGAAVSVCGLRGFVGLIIPNIIRLFGHHNTKISIILCMVFGSDFLLLCDLLARVLFFPYELPVGLFMSILGAPFFIWMLINKRKKLCM